MADKNKQGEYYSRPAKLGKWEGFKQFLWNSETSECLGRTGGSWGKLKKYFKDIFFFFPGCYVTQNCMKLFSVRKKHGGLSHWAGITYNLKYTF